ncbi:MULTISPECIES: hypothetical protein [unclassified Spirosoma]|nr:MULTISPECIES: hypothetical protein [unclassified Spirosoma]
MKFKHCLLLSLILSSLMIGSLMARSIKAQHKASTAMHQSR